MSKRPWMPLYIADYLVDTMHLNARQNGSYLLLIMHYWLEGTLPNDDISLIRIARTTPKWWRRDRPILLKFFRNGSTHKRIDAELRAVSLKSLKKNGSKITRGRPGSSPGKRYPPKNINNINAPFSTLQTQTHKDRKKERKQSSTARARARVCDCAPPDAVKFGLKQNWDQSRIAEEWQSFRDYHLAHGKQPKDFMAAWRNWCRSPFRNSNSHSPQQPPRPGSREDRKEKSANALRKSKAYVAQTNDEGPGSRTDQQNARLIPFHRPPRP